MAGRGAPRARAASSDWRRFIRSPGGRAAAIAEGVGALSDSLPIEVQLALVADGQDTDFIPGRDEAIQRNVAGSAVGDHELAQFALCLPSDEGMLRQQLDGRAYRRCRIQVRGRILCGRKLEGALEVGKRIGRVDYLRQGFGRADFLPAARRSTQA